MKKDEGYLSDELQQAYNKALDRMSISTGINIFDDWYTTSFKVKHSPFLKAEIICYECKICKEQFTVLNGILNFCPACGRKAIGSEEENE